MSLSIQPPYPVVNDTDGQPLENGYIWIGAANLPPITNPISIYWDAALTQPAAQPVRTQGGYPSNAGNPGRLYAAQNYSILVQNSRGVTLYSAPQQTEKYWQIIATKSSSQPAADYNATMTATVPFTLATADGLCRYLGSGMSWDCAADSFDAAQKKITRQNITQFSDWAAAQAATAGSVFICLSSNDQFPRKL